MKWVKLSTTFFDSETIQELTKQKKREEVLLLVYLISKAHELRVKSKEEDLVLKIKPKIIAIDLNERLHRIKQQLTNLLKIGALTLIEDGPSKVSDMNDYQIENEANPYSNEASRSELVLNMKDFHIIKVEVTVCNVREIIKNTFSRIEENKKRKEIEAPSGAANFSSNLNSGMSTPVVSSSQEYTEEELEKMDGAARGAYLLKKARERLVYRPKDNE